MAKKKNSKATNSKSKSFRLQGKHTKQNVAMYLLVDLAIGFVLGFLLQPTIVALVTAYAAGTL